MSDVIYIITEGRPRSVAPTDGRTLTPLSSNMSMIDDCERALSRLLQYCRSEAWLGYDPYDALNSPLAKSFLFQYRFPRIALTQLVKRCPFNLRPAIGIDKRVNPKGVALAARALMLLADR